MRLLASLTCLFIFSLPVFSQKLDFDSSFAPTIDGTVNSVEVLGDGKILISGSFNTVNGVTRKGIARLNADGTLDTSFDANWLGGAFNQPLSISAMTLLDDGKILVAGNLPFDGSSGNLRVRRLNSDGTPDATLTSVPFVAHSSFFQIIHKVNQLPNGKIFLCGNFDLPSGNAQPGLARYNADGTYDSTFTTAINHDCLDVAVLPDNKYYISGYYSTINGNPSQSLTRFNADDSIDTSFNAVPVPNTGDQTIYAKIELQNDGRIIAFRAPGCCTYRATRLDPDGSVHTNFSTSIDEPGDFVFQSNGKLTIIAEFENVFGQSGDLNRFNTDGTHDPSLNRMNFSGLGFPVYPKAGAFTADEKLIVGGNFTRFSLSSGGAQINQAYLARFTPQAIPIKPKYDFDGDGRSDIAVFRPGNQVWYLNRSADGFSATQFGLSTDVPVTADYDGDGRSDIAVFRDGVWYWLRSSDSVFAFRTCGQAGDIPTPTYNRNTNTLGFLVFRPSAAQFYSQQPYGNPQPVEFRDMTLLPTDKPVIADYDGDGRDDLAVFRDGNWFFMASNNLQTRHYQFGLAGDRPVTGDFDGDLRADFAVFRPSNGTWYIQKSSEGFTAVNWGLADDLPVPADYDGDGKTDIAVYRPSNGVWYQFRSTSSYHFEQFGLAGDIPVQAR